MFERLPDVVGVGKAAREERRKAEHKRKEAAKSPPVFELAEKEKLEKMAPLGKFRKNFDDNG
jgi:hypothetical protein